MRFARSLYQGSASAGIIKLGGATSPNLGNLAFATGDGAMAALATANLDGAAFTLLMGATDDLRANHVQVMGGKTAGLLGFDKVAAQLAIQDILQRLAAPVITATYAGTGDLEGGADAVGKAKPFAGGLCRNITPVLLDGPLQIFQWNAGPSGIRPSQSLDAVRVNGGSGGTIGADNANYAALKAAAVAGIAAGTVQTCLAASCFAVGGAATTNGAQVTCDVHGDSAGSYVSSAAKIFERLLLVWANPVFVAGSDYDAAAITALDTLNSAVCNLYISDSSTTLQQAADKLIANTLGGFYYGSRLGLLTVGRLDPPNIAGPDDANCKAVFTQKDFGRPGSQGAFKLLPLGAPPWRWQLNYRANYTVQKSGLATGLTPDLVQQYGNPFRTTTPNDNATVRSARPSSLPAIVDTNFDAAGDANTERDRRAGLFVASNAPRRACGGTVGSTALKLNPGDQVWITDDTLLPAGAAVRIVGVDDDLLSTQCAITGLLAA